MRVHAERKLADLIMDTKSYRKDEVDELLGQRGPVDTDALRRFAIGALAELGVVIDDRPRRSGALIEVRLRGVFENEFPQFVKDGAVRDAHVRSLCRPGSRRPRVLRCRPRDRRCPDRTCAEQGLWRPHQLPAHLDRRA